MNSGKITQLHVYLIGFVVILLLGGGLWYTLLKPLNEEVTALQGQVNTTETTSVQVDGRSFNISQAEAAKTALEDAKKRRVAKARQLASIENRKRLPRSQSIDVGDGTEPVLISRTMPRWLQLPRVLVETMENYAQKLAKKHGVAVTTQFSVPAPSTNPSAIPKDVIARNLGGMTVTGSFDRVMRWATDWNSAPLLVSVDGLKMVLAEKDKVRATAGLTVYLFPTGKGVQTASASGTGGAAPAGGMGGGMGGMIGYPGGPDPMAGGGMTNSPGGNTP